MKSVVGRGAVAGVVVMGAGTAMGRVGPFNFGAATNAIFANSDGFRIDAASDAANSSTGAGMTFFQRDPASAGAGFSTANPALVFRFDVITQAGGNMRIIHLSLDELSRGVGSYYSSSSATGPTTASVSLEHGTIGLGIPTPGAAAVMGLAGMVGARRRRR
jgi:hypothetical protein